ncbi:MAG: bacillithiol biosynthesis cysteine-adding enzyme BshC, partial [Chitinophagaceae bacterium]
GRMQCDQNIQQLIESIGKELSHFSHAQSLLDLLKKSYAKGNTMADATFNLLNELFGNEGLLVLQPDDAALKQVFVNVMQDDLLNSTAEAVVNKSIEALSNSYKVQVNPRPVNLFYLRDGIRNRIDKRGDQYSVDGTVIRFQQKEIIEELKAHPERFSPNVILRGLYQETILPNIAFIGGGSEIAYWLELKSLFEHYGIPYPVLVLRNSFMVVDKHQWHKLNELQLSEADLFKEETALANEMIQRWSDREINLEAETKNSRVLFDQLKNRAGTIDKTLTQHVHALEVFHMKKLESLEKKMLKAERKKQSTQLQRIWKLKSELFPNDTLQERKLNFMPFYAQYGPAFIQSLLRHSLSLEQKFEILIIE